MKNGRRAVLIVCIVGMLMASLLSACDLRQQTKNVWDAIETVSKEPEDHLLDMVQTGKYLYLSLESGVYRCDTTTGEMTLTSLPVSDMMELGGREELYLYSYSDNTLYHYRTDGNLIDQYAISWELDAEEAIISFNVTDDYYVFLSSNHHDLETRKFYIVNRKTFEVEQVTSNFTAERLYRYRDNAFLMYCDSDEGSYFVWYDIESDTVSKRYNSAYAYDAVYLPDRDCIVYCERGSFNVCTIRELSLSDGTWRDLFSCVTESKDLRCAAADNIVCIGGVCDDTVQLFDYEKEYPAVHFAYYKSSPHNFRQLSEFIFAKYGFNVIAHRYESVEKLNLALLSGSSDIDLYYTGETDSAYYVRAHAYTDLRTVGLPEDLLNRTQTLLEASSTYEGEIFGVPSLPRVYDTQTDTAPSGKRYNCSVYHYMSRYIDLTENSYTDDGTALAELLTHLKQYPGDDADKPIFGHYRMLDGYHLMMNPNAANRERAVIVMSEMLRMMLGEYNDTMERLSFYVMPTPERIEGAIPLWKCYDVQIEVALYEASRRVQGGEDPAAVAKEVSQMISRMVCE